MPRSVTYCLGRCAELLRASLPLSSPTAEQAQTFLDQLLRSIRRLDWYSFFVNHEESNIRLLHREQLLPLLQSLLGETQELHHIITDNFLSHQSIISAPEPTLF
jgi:A predicted alpha-helical domain with a conserved ER motif.